MSHKEEKKPFKHHEKGHHYHPEVLTTGWTKSKLLIRFDDATADANGNYRFTINDPIPDVVFAEWITVSSGIVGSLMVVDELNSDGQTTQKITNTTTTSGSYTPPAPPAPIPPPSAFSSTTPYAVGSKVSYSGKDYVLNFNVSKAPTNPDLGHGWVSNDSFINEYDATKTYRKNDWVFVITNIDGHKGRDNYQLVTPDTYPAVQPDPTTDNTVWGNKNNVPAFSGTEFYTAGNSFYAPSLVTFSGSSFYVLQTHQDNANAELAPTNEDYNNWNEYKAPTPNVNPEAQPYYPPALPNTSSQTTSFWRMLSDTNNYLSPSLAEPLMNPKTLYYLNVKLYNPDGTKFTVPSGSFVQIFIWGYCCKDHK